VSPRPTTLPGLLETLATAQPDATAAVFGAETETFADLEERSRRLAAGLYAEGVRAGDAVAVWLPNCPAWIELQFALARLGALLICTNTRYRSHELGGVLAQSRARWLVLAPEFRGIDFPAILAETPAEQRAHLEGVIVHGDPQRVASVVGARATGLATLFHDGPGPDVAGAAPEQPCVAFASSGSTGVPKLIVHTQTGIAGHAVDVANRFYDEEGATALVTLPLSGVFGYVTFMGALAGGRPSILMEAFDDAEAVDLIERHRVTTVTGPDEVMLRIIEAADPPARIASWREGGFGAQSVDSELLIARGDETGVCLFQCYGSSECLGLMARQPRGATPAERAVGGGAPVSPDAGVRVRSEETGALLPPGEPGLLEISAPSVMAGYLHQPEVTASAFTDDGWFRTGDIGYLVDGTSRFVFLTRNNDVLRLSGFLVEPQEIEHFIEQLAGVAAAQAVGIQTGRGVRVVAFIVQQGGASLSEADVIEHCSRSLAKYKVPRRVFTVDTFPTTPSANGDKVQRGKLRDLAYQLVAETAKA
jgi:fatty-acyl-CoA synthase